MANKLKRKTNSNISKVVYIVLVVFAIFFFVDIFKRVYNIFALQKQSELIEEQLQIIKDENASLIDTKEKLEDPDYVQTYARGEYMFSKGDEKVFYLPGE